MGRWTPLCTTTLPSPRCVSRCKVLNTLALWCLFPVVTILASQLMCIDLMMTGPLMDVCFCACAAFQQTVVAVQGVLGVLCCPLPVHMAPGVLASGVLGHLAPLLKRLLSPSAALYPCEVDGLVSPAPVTITGPGQHIASPAVSSCMSLLLLHGWWLSVVGVQHAAPPTEDLPLLRSVSVCVSHCCTT